MKYYTETISADLARKLKEKGMPIEMQPLYAQEAPNARGIVKAGVGLWCPSYAEVFDWLIERGLTCEITRYIDFGHEEVCPEWDWSIEKVGPLTDAPGGYANTWHEAANAAIEKALTLI